MILPAKRKRALRRRNHAEGYPGGLIETMNGGVRARSCAAQPPSSQLRHSRGERSGHGRVRADYPDGFRADLAVWVGAGRGCFAAADSAEGAVYVLGEQ